MNDIKQAIKKFIISLIGRRMIFLIITNIEKWTITVLCVEQSLELSWQVVALIIAKDIVVLRLLDMIQFEKIQLKASIGS